MKFKRFFSICFLFLSFQCLVHSEEKNVYLVTTLSGRGESVDLFASISSLQECRDWSPQKPESGLPQDELIEKALSEMRKRKGNSYKTVLRGLSWRNAGFEPGSSGFWYLTVYVVYPPKDWSGVRGAPEDSIFLLPNGEVLSEKLSAKKDLEEGSSPF